MYSRYIRAIDGPISSLTRLDNHIWPYLARVTEGSITPNLRTVSLDVKMTPIDPITLLPSSNLEKVSIWNNDQSTERGVLAFLNIALSCSAPISSIDLITASKHLLDIVPSFQRLTSLVLGLREGPDDLYFLTRLSLLPLLKALVLNTCEGKTYSPDLDFDRADFAQLSQMWVSCSPQFALRLFQKMSAKQLRTLRIQFDRFTPASKVSLELFPTEVFAAAPGLRLLRLDHESIGNYYSRGIRVHMIPPLPRYCETDDAIKTHLTDQDIHQLIKSGRLANLWHFWVPSSPSNKAPTLSSLGILARHSPKLASVNLSFDMQEHHILSLEDEMIRYPRMSHALKTLTIGWTRKEPLNNAHSLKLVIIVSQYIHHFFPFIEKVLPGLNCGKEWCDGINAMVKSYQKAGADPRFSK